MLKTCICHNGPAAMRYPRGAGLGVPLDPEIETLEIGKGEVIKEGGDIAIFAYGHMVETAEEVARMLAKDGINAAVINARFAKPVDKDLVGRYAGITNCFVTLEEHALKGGFGSAILETLHEEKFSTATQVKCIGMPDIVLEHGSPTIQRKDLKLDVDGVYETVLEHYREMGKGSAISGEDKKLLSGNGTKAFIKPEKKHLKIKHSVNG